MTPAIYYRKGRIFFSTTNNSETGENIQLVCTLCDQSMNLSNLMFLSAEFNNSSKLSAFYDRFPMYLTLLPTTYLFNK